MELQPWQPSDALLGMGSAALAVYIIHWLSRCGQIGHEYIHYAFPTPDGLGARPNRHLEAEVAVTGGSAASKIMLSVRRSLLPAAPS